MEKTLTVREAYLVMIRFLEGYYERTNSGELGGFLGGFNILEDGDTADPAAWNDWIEAVNEVKPSNEGGL